MQVAIWATPHEIASTVTSHFDSTHHFNTNQFDDYEYAVSQCDVHIGYGILRGMDKVYEECERQGKHYFIVDNGYSSPGHYHGHYRISYKGTQAKWRENMPQKDCDVVFDDWRNNEGYILICPPTEPVIDFFGLKRQPGLISTQWEVEATNLALGLNWSVQTRHKHSTNPIDWENVRGVITFNSSVGWQALQRGIPCISDENSIVGSYYKHELRKKGLEYNFENVKLIPREPLFRAMAAHQYTLKEIREGKACGLINHYLSMSDSTQGKL